jgi:hypothetical protein
MSIVTLDWPPSKSRGAEDLATQRSVTGLEAVFRSALETYIADYERHLATVVTDRHRRAQLIRRSLLARLAQRLWG